MSVYILRTKRNRRGRPLYFVAADKYWELKQAAKLYATTILKDKRGHYYLFVTERQKLRGVRYEVVVPSPKPRMDARNFSASRSGGSAGDVSSSNVSSSNASGGGRTMGDVSYLPGSGGGTAQSGASRGGVSRDGTVISPQKTTIVKAKPT